MNRWIVAACIAVLAGLPAFGCGSGGGAADADPGVSVPDTVEAEASTDVAEEASPDLVAEASIDVAPETPAIEISPPDRPLCPVVAGTPGTVVTIDPAGAGRVFDGLGAISNAGNSRYLVEYPEPQRSQALDYLFKPGYGASLQVLKVEIAGDMNSTSGSEASHRHTVDDLDCSRGYEWWLMKEAKARNPSIRLAALAWGSPGWTPHGTFYTPALIDYLVSWLGCAQTHGLTIDYLGGRNESGMELDWFKALKDAMVKGGFATKLVAADTHQAYGWMFAIVASQQPELAAFVDVVGVHYPCYYDTTDATSCDAPPEVLGLSLPIWASEQGGDSASYGRILTRGYVEGHLTGFHHWPLMASLPEGLPFGDSGLLVAGQPWSGAFTTKPLLWTFAHLTQTTEPGWRYLDAASGHLAGDRARGAYVTLVSPDGSFATTLIETSTASQDEVIEVAFPDSMPKRVVHVFESDTSSSDPAAQFVHGCDLDPAAGPVRVTVAPHRFVTLTTTVPKARGDAAAPQASPFPLPYDNDLEAETPGQEARFLANQNGAFEVVPCGGGRSGRCLRQAAAPVPSFWGPQISNPYAVIGDSNLRDVTLRVDVMPEQDGTIELLGRVFNVAYFAPLRHEGYVLRIDTGGDWSIGRYDPAADDPVPLAQGKIAAWPTGTWRTVELALDGSSIRARLDGQDLGIATDSTWSRGLVGIGANGGATGTGWHPVQFDNLHILSAVPGS